MNFLAPLAFWFGLTIPVVVLFYLLKRKRTLHLVSSTLLWQRFLAETQASAPFQRLRHNWLLVLQILLLALAVLALGRPYFSGQTKGGRLLVVILDNSASMQSTDEAPSRFEKARGEALRMVDAMHDDDQMIVLQAGAITEVKQSPTSEKSILRRKIQGAEVTDTPTRLGEALKLAETLTRNNALAEVHLYSDGAASQLDGFDNKGLPLFYHRVGRRSENLGIITIDVRPHPEDPGRRTVFAGVANFSSETKQTQIELRFNDQLLEVKPVTLRSGETTPEVFAVAQRESGVFMVRLVASDDLAVDNQASIVSLLPKALKVLLVTGGNRLLEKAVRIHPNTEVSVAGSLTSGSELFDVVILDNVQPVVWPGVNTLAFVVAATNWFENVMRFEGPPIVDWKSAHPLLRAVTLDNVLVAESFGAKAPGWAAPLVDSPQASLIMAGELGRQRIVWVGFDVLQSTWPLRVSFPIFIANALDWLNPVAVSAAQLTLRAGDPFRSSLEGGVSQAEVTLPDGTVKPASINPVRGELIFGETRHQGVYRVNAGTNAMAFCVNLMDAAESETTPRAELQLGQHTRVSTTTERRATLELWRWAAVVALVVLLLEWWYYHRRTV